MPATARQADLVWEVERAPGQRGLLHIELQTRVEADIGERLAEYGIRLWRRDHMPVRSVVVYLRETRAVPASPFVIPWDAEADSLRCQYDVLRLWELPPERVLGSTSYELWPLASLMAGASVENMAAVAGQLAASPLPRQERSDLVTLLVGLASIRLPGAALVAALRRNAMIDEALSDLLRDSTVMAASFEEGKAEGNAEGKAEGKAEEARRMAQGALEGRFGALSEELLAALGVADEPTLEAVAAHVATDTLEQMRGRFGLS